MKKLVAIFLLLQFLTNNAFAEELIKLPKLFTHFYHHSNEHHDSDDFVDFLVDHYSDNHKENKHDEDDNDCDLPFKHCEGCCLTSHIPLIAFIPSFNGSEFVFSVISKEKYSNENEKIKSMCSPPIWQPPKLA
ncbi:MAG: hypothetical protein H0U95_02145 [Bacteroidetes bacterium]|nr:hypothetical protein [Bacteroidota bacterium]